MIIKRNLCRFCYCTFDWIRQAAGSDLLRKTISIFTEFKCFFLLRTHCMYDVCDVFLYYYSDCTETFQTAWHLAWWPDHTPLFKLTNLLSAFFFSLLCCLQWRLATMLAKACLPFAVLMSCSKLGPVQCLMFCIQERRFLPIPHTPFSFPSIISCLGNLIFFHVWGYDPFFYKTKVFL